MDDWGYYEDGETIVNILDLYTKEQLSQYKMFAIVGWAAFPDGDYPWSGNDGVSEMGLGFWNGPYQIKFSMPIDINDYNLHLFVSMSPGDGRFYGRIMGDEDISESSFAFEIYKLIGIK